MSVTLVYCGQTVGSIKMPLGMEVGLGQDHIVLDGDPPPGSIKMPLGMEVGLGPGDIVLDGDQAPPRKKGAQPTPESGTQPQFSAHICYIPSGLTIFGPYLSHNQ